MDEDDSIVRGPARPAGPAAGGTVEPVDRATVARERLQTPPDVPAERYELRDPFADVTHRTASFEAAAAKAEQFGSSRFVALDAEGRRSSVQRVDGEWQRGPQRPALPERPVDASPVRDDVPQVDGAEPGAWGTKGRNADTGTRAVAVDLKAEREALVERLEAGLKERYVIKRASLTIGIVPIGGREYRFKGDTSRVAFTESRFRLSTDTNSPSVARSMVDVAEARNWRGLRVSGNEDFRRLVWLEASVRGVRTLGYEPNPADLDVLRKEREARHVNRIEPERTATADAAAPAATDKPAARGSGGRKAVLAAIEAVLVAKGVPEKKREAVMSAATQQLAQRMRDGQAVPKVKVYDQAAPSQRAVPVPAPEVQRARERAPAR